MISESLDELEKHKGELDYMYASLTLDGMSIKELVEYCPDLKRTFGTVDYGQDVSMGETDKSKPANEALVAMLVGIKGNWKLPIGYFLINGLKASILSGIIRNCLILTYNIGMLVLNVTMDGTGHNVSALEKLGAKILVQERIQMKTSFPHPNETAGYEVSVYLDPLHMFKLIRNTLADYKELYWPGHGYIR